MAYIKLDHEFVCLFGLMVYLASTFKKKSSIYQVFCKRFSPPHAIAGGSATNLCEIYSFFNIKIRKTQC